MTEEKDATSSKVTQLGSWMPKKRGLKRFLNRELIVSVVFFALTMVVLFSGDQMSQVLSTAYRPF